MHCSQRSDASHQSGLRADGSADDGSHQSGLHASHRRVDAPSLRLAPEEVLRRVQGGPPSPLKFDRRAV
jgi:hypothetical protein